MPLCVLVRTGLNLRLISQPHREAFFLWVEDQGRQTLLQNPYLILYVSPLRVVFSVISQERKRLLLSL